MNGLNYIETMESPSVPDPKGSIFSFLASVFKRQQVSVVLVGGYAVIANKIQRMTFDIDFILTLEHETKIEPELVASGYAVAHRQEAFVQFKSEKPGFRDLDFLITDEQTITKLIKKGRQVGIGGEFFTIPAPIHLVAMKLHSIAGNKDRETKDFPDILQLMELPEMVQDQEQVRDLFEKYNLQHLYSRAVDLKKAGHERRK